MMKDCLAKKKKRDKEEIVGWIFANIPLAGFIVFGLIPLLFSVYLCFNQFKGLRLNTATFVGFENFGKVLSDELFGKAIVNTLFVVVAMLISLALSLIMSVLLNSKMRGEKFFKAVFFLPYVCSMVAVTFMWKWIFDYNSGVLNTLLLNLRLIDERINWLGNADYYRASMMVLLIWGGCGFNIILFGAALTSVNRTLYEAADLDGAGALVKFFRITMPAISPTTFYLLVMGIIGSLQTFTQFQVMSPDGGPEYQGLTVVFYLYRLLFNASGGSDLGMASAVGWIIALMITVVTLLNFKLSKKWVSYD